MTLGWTLSFTEGFWPAHHGGGAEKVPSTIKSLHIPKSVEHLDFTQSTVEEEVTKGWTSAAFNEPLPGMTVSPLFVIRVKKHCPRVVGDHTASGLNDRIKREDVPVTYDTVIDLIRLMRHNKVVTVKADKGVLWKLDVMAAFKLLVMHPCWQAHQAIAVSYAQPDSSWRLQFHGSLAVVRHLTYGHPSKPPSSGSPRIGSGSPSPSPTWTTISGSTSPLSSGLMTVAHRDGSTFVAPQEQATMANLWDILNIPYKISKVLSGRCIPITGLNVDAEQFIVAFPDSVREALEREILNFLTFPGRNLPLRCWHQIAGWTNWVVTVFPLGRPLLSPIFGKLYDDSGLLKSHPHAGVFISKTVISSLRSLLDVLHTNDLLDLLEPGSTEWTLEDTDVVIYTDTCLTCHDKTGAGLSFWFDYEGERFAFYSRPGRTFKEIQFAESLTVVAAIVPVVRARIPHLRRLLV
jgi:hypothetical protein